MEFLQRKHSLPHISEATRGCISTGWSCWVARDLWSSGDGFLAALKSYYAGNLSLFLRVKLGTTMRPIGLEASHFMYQYGFSSIWELPHLFPWDCRAPITCSCPLPWLLCGRSTLETEALLNHPWCLSTCCWKWNFSHKETWMTLKNSCLLCVPWSFACFLQILLIL